MAGRLRRPGSIGGDIYRFRPAIPECPSTRYRRSVDCSPHPLGATTDVPTFLGLSKALAGIVTGNLVMAGYGVAAGNAALVKLAA